MNGDVSIANIRKGNVSIGFRYGGLSMGFMADQYKKAKNEKFDELFEQKPFLTLHPLERMWWIRYCKLRVAAERTGWGQYEKFPEFPDGPIVDRPWFKLDHWINHELNVIQRYVELEGFDWEHLQDYQVEMVFCERHPDEGCAGCNHVLICNLRGE